VALLAVLLSDEPGVTHRALVDGVGLGDDRLSRRLAAAAPGGLTAGVRAMEPAPERLKAVPQTAQAIVSVSLRTLFSAHLLGALDEHAVVEDGASADESDEMGGVDGPPAALGRGDELVGHGQSGRA